MISHKFPHWFRFETMQKNKKQTREHSLSICVSWKLLISFFLPIVPRTAHQFCLCRHLIARRFLSRPSICGLDPNYQCSFTYHVAKLAAIRGDLVYWRIVFNHASLIWPHSLRGRSVQPSEKQRLRVSAFIHHWQLLSSIANLSDRYIK